MGYEWINNFIRLKVFRLISVRLRALKIRFDDAKLSALLMCSKMTVFVIKLITLAP